MLRRARLARTRPDDPALLALVAEGETAAFELFCDRHAWMAYVLAYELVGERQGAEELVLETLQAIWAGVVVPARGPLDAAEWLGALLRHGAGARARTPEGPAAGPVGA